MDNEETADNRYPSGFEHIKEMVDNAKDQIRQIDELIENLPDDRRGPALRLDPPVRSGPGSRSIATSNNELAMRKGRRTSDRRRLIELNRNSKHQTRK